MPPSPRLSARRISSAYLSEMIRISAHRISDTTPRTASGVERPAVGWRPWRLPSARKAGWCRCRHRRRRARRSSRQSEGALGVRRIAAGVAVTDWPPQRRARPSARDGARSASLRRQSQIAIGFVVRSECRLTQQTGVTSAERKAQGASRSRSCDLEVVNWCCGLRSAVGGDQAGFADHRSWSRRRAGRKLRNSARPAASSRWPTVRMSRRSALGERLRHAGFDLRGKAGQNGQRGGDERSDSDGGKSLDHDGPLSWALAARSFRWLDL